MLRFQSVELASVEGGEWEVEGGEWEVVGGEKCNSIGNS